MKKYPAGRNILNPRRRITSAVVLGGIAMLSGLSAIAAETASSDPASDPSILRLISRLGDDEFQVRRQAERDLQQLGAAAIDPLAAEAVRQDPVIARSAVSLLEKLFVDGCIDVADRAERALESLADSQHPYAGEMARSALAGNQQLRERRAVAAIRELGGKVEYQSPSDAQLANMQFGWNFSLDDNRIPGVPLAVVHVWLLKGWQGGEEGLWHVQRLEDSWSARLWGVEVTNVRGSGVTTEQVQSLAASIPNLTVHERGAGLGIKASPVGECIVSDVLANGAAEHAGIMRGDVIVGFDDKPIESFNDLVSLLLERTPDEVVEIDVQRGLERVTLPVTLRGWRDMDTGGRKDPPPLSPDPAETDRPIFVPFQPPRER